MCEIQAPTPIESNFHRNYSPVFCDQLRFFLFVHLFIQQLNVQNSELSKREIRLKLSGVDVTGPKSINRYRVWRKN